LHLDDSNISNQSVLNSEILLHTSSAQEKNKLCSYCHYSGMWPERQLYAVILMLLKSSILKINQVITN